MAQIACVKVPASGWAKVEDLIKEALGVESWDWGTSTYQMQNTGLEECYLVESNDEPEPEHGPGFLIGDGTTIVIYVGRTVPLWVKAVGGDCYINIATVGEGE